MFFVVGKSNLEDDELNLPRLPEESPRPCPLCLINRGWNNASNSINLPEQKPKTVLAPTAKPEIISNYNTKSYNLTKRHKSNDYSKEISAKAKPEKLAKTPPQKKDYDSNSDGESEVSTNNVDLKKGMLQFVLSKNLFDFVMGFFFKEFLLIFAFEINA